MFIPKVANGSCAVPAYIRPCKYIFVFNELWRLYAFTCVCISVHTNECVCVCGLAKTYVCNTFKHVCVFKLDVSEFCRWMISNSQYVCVKKSRMNLLFRLAVYCSVQLCACVCVFSVFFRSYFQYIPLILLTINKTQQRISTQLAKFMHNYRIAKKSRNLNN